MNPNELFRFTIPIGDWNGKGPCEYFHALTTNSICVVRDTYRNAQKLLPKHMWPENVRSRKFTDLNEDVQAVFNSVGRLKESLQLKSTGLYLTNLALASYIVWFINEGNVRPNTDVTVKLTSSFVTNFCAPDYGDPEPFGPFGFSDEIEVTYKKHPDLLFNNADLRKLLSCIEGSWGKQSARSFYLRDGHEVQLHSALYDPDTSILSLVVLSVYTFYYAELVTDFPFSISDYTGLFFSEVEQQTVELEQYYKVSDNQKTLLHTVKA
jgi:hypothetical protein